MGQSKAATDDATVPEQSPNVHRMRVRCDIEVFGDPSHEQIPDAAAAEVRTVAAPMQTVEDLQDVLGDVSTRDAVGGAFYDSSLGIELESRVVLRIRLSDFVGHSLDPAPPDCRS